MIIQCSGLLKLCSMSPTAFGSIVQFVAGRCNVCHVHVDHGKKTHADHHDCCRQRTTPWVDNVFRRRKAIPVLTRRIPKIACRSGSLTLFTPRPERLTAGPNAHKPTNPLSSPVGKRREHPQSVFEIQWFTNRRPNPTFCWNQAGNPLAVCSCYVYLSLWHFVVVAVSVKCGVLFLFPRNELKSLRNLDAS